MRADSDTSESFRRFSEDYAREFHTRCRQATLQWIESQKAVLEQVDQRLKDHHETGSGEFSKFIRMLMTSQLEALKLLREAEERAFDLQSGMIQSYLQMLEQLKNSLQGDEPNHDGQPSDS